MGYRRQKWDEKHRDWLAWLRQNEEQIAASGLPELVLSDEAHWSDFLDNGHLDHHPDPSGFSLDDLSVRQKAAMLRLLLNYRDGLTTVVGQTLVWYLVDAVEQAYPE
jgi:hypothetical protein